MKSRGIDDPEMFECLRCGYCCKELFHGIELYEEDIYLGIKLYSWSKNKKSIYPTFDKVAKICGWAYHHDLNPPNEASSSGGTPAYWKELKRLRSLKELDELIRPPTDARNVFG